MVRVTIFIGKLKNSPLSLEYNLIYKIGAWSLLDLSWADQGKLQTPGFFFISWNLIHEHRVTCCKEFFIVDQIPYHHEKPFFVLLHAFLL